MKKQRESDGAGWSCSPLLQLPLLLLLVPRRLLLLLPVGVPSVLPALIHLDGRVEEPRSPFPRLLLVFPCLLQPVPLLELLPLLCIRLILLFPPHVVHLMLFLKMHC